MNYSDTANKNKDSIDLLPYIRGCLDAERARNLSERSIKELGMHLGKLNTYCNK